LRVDTDTVLCFFSSRPNWDPTPSPAGECPSPLWFGGGGAHSSLAVEGMGESQFGRGDRHCGTLGTYVLFWLTLTGETTANSSPGSVKVLLHESCKSNTTLRKRAQNSAIRSRLLYILVPIAVTVYIYSSVYDLNTYSALRKNPPKTMKGIMTMGRMLRHTSRLGQAQDTRYPAQGLFHEIFHLFLT
jgi:hypothetical protein